MGPIDIATVWHAIGGAGFIMGIFTLMRFNRLEREITRAQLAAAVAMRDAQKALNR